MIDPAIGRPVGFFLLMLGFGLRLDTDWRALATTLLLLGATGTALGLWTKPRRRSGDVLPSPPEPGDNAPSVQGGQTGGTTCVPRSA